MPFLKEDLIGEHYNWNQSSAFNGAPSRRLFDRFNGNQVLFIINFYGSLSGQFTIQEGRKMEDLILNHLPMEAKSEVSVFNWLRQAGS
jgi:hypothetical protein